MGLDFTVTTSMKVMGLDFIISVVKQTNKQTKKNESYGIGVYRQCHKHLHKSYGVGFHRQCRINVNESYEVGFHCQCCKNINGSYGVGIHHQCHKTSTKVMDCQ